MIGFRIGLLCLVLGLGFSVMVMFGGMWLWSVFMVTVVGAGDTYIIAIYKN